MFSIQGLGRSDLTTASTLEDDVHGFCPVLPALDVGWQDVRGRDDIESPGDHDDNRCLKIKGPNLIYILIIENVLQCVAYDIRATVSLVLVWRKAIDPSDELLDSVDVEFHNGISDELQGQIHSGAATSFHPIDNSPDIEI